MRDLWHQRLCLAATTPGRVGGTPDGDVYEKWFSYCTDIHLCGPRGVIPDVLQRMASICSSAGRFPTALGCVGHSSKSILSKWFLRLQLGSIQCIPPSSCHCLVPLRRSPVGSIWITIDGGGIILEKSDVMIEVGDVDGLRRIRGKRRSMAS